MKILLPVNGTSISSCAVKTAIDLASKFNFTIKIICIIKPGELRAYKRNTRIWQQSDGSILDKNARLIDDDHSKIRLRKKISENLYANLDKIDMGNIKIETEIAFGKFIDIILMKAKIDRFDLILMANKDLLINKLCLKRNIIKKLIIKAPCPVLIISTDMR